MSIGLNAFLAKLTPQKLNFCYFSYGNIHKPLHRPKYSIINYWQKSKTDPITFRLFHFSPLTVSFVISVL